MRNIFLGTALITTLASSAFLSACSGDIGKLPFDTGGGGGEGGSGNGGNGTGGDPIDNPQFSPAPGGIRKLLGRQYVNSIRQVLGDGAAAKAAPPADTTLNEFETLAAAELALPPTAVEQYETSAIDVSDAVIFDTVAMSKLVPCTPAAVNDAACHQQVIESLGHQLWRRPLTADEVAPIVQIAQTAATEYDSFDFGVKYALMTLLQSPYFLYTTEVGVEDAEHPGWFKLTGPELATRMSLFLVDSIPDAALLQKAETGGLDTEEQVRATARELMKLPAARAALASFYDVVFKLRDLPTTTKIPETFPEWNESLAQSMRQETLMFFEDLVWNQNGDYRDAYIADYTFVDANLAALYGVAPPSGGGFAKTTIPASQLRSGFLGHASYLTRYSHAGETSPTRRGVFLSNLLLCNEIQPPPPGVNTMFPPFDPQNPKTKKEHLEEVHTKDDNCHSCHSLMDPFGYPSEVYDAIGKHRTTDENGLSLDPSGEVVGFGAFSDLKQLGQLMHDDASSMNCIVSNLFRQSTGHRETKGERPAILSIQSRFGSSGYKLQEAIVEIIASPAFSYVNLPK